MATRKAVEKKPKKPFVHETDFERWFIAALRRASRKYPPHYQAENAVKEEYFIESKNGKPLRRVRITCAQCKNKFSTGDVKRDHIEPVIDPTVGFPRLANGKADWNRYIERMFVEQSKIQMLCDNCHDIKTGKENKSRRKKSTHKVE